MVERSGIDPVRFPKTARTGTTVSRFKITDLKNDHVVAHTWNGIADDEGTKDVKIAKPWLLRRNTWDGKSRDGISYSYIDDQQRTATNAEGEIRIESLKETYAVGDELYAVDRPIRGTGVTLNPGEDNEEVLYWLDINAGGRRWHSLNEFDQRPGVIYHCDDIADKIYLIDPQNLCVDCEFVSPGPGSSGIGGDKFNLWHSDDSTNTIYKLDPDQFLIITSALSPLLSGDRDPTGCGGATGDPDADPVIPDVLYFCDDQANRVGTLDPATLALISDTAAPGVRPSGIGGDQTKVWHCDWEDPSGPQDETIFELAPDTLAVVRQGSAPGDTPEGIGGIATAIWHADRNDDRLYELDPTTSGFPVIRSKPSPSVGAAGIGGT